MLLVLAAMGALGALELPRPIAEGVLATHTLFFLVVWVGTVSTKSALGPDGAQALDPDISLAAFVASVAIALVAAALVREGLSRPSSGSS